MVELRVVRKLEYTDEIGEEICARLAIGRSLVSICRDDKDMPCLSTVFRWLSKVTSFSDMYARAREAQADALFEETLDISNNPVIGSKVTVEQAPSTFNADTGEEIEGPKIIKTTTYDMIEHRKLQIETRKWVAGKLRPRKYGATVVQAEISGPEGTPMRTINMEPSEYAQIAAKVVKEF